MQILGPTTVIQTPNEKNATHSFVSCMKSSPIKLRDSKIWTKKNNIITNEM